MAVVDIGELLAGLPDGGGVDEGHDLLQVVDDDVVEQGLVELLQAAQVLVLVDGGGFGAEAGEHAVGLGREIVHARGNKACQTEKRNRKNKKKKKKLMLI